MQILHYEHGQKYEPHFDFFHDKANLELGGHRIATVLMYLSNVAKGGETIFPHSEVSNDTLTICFYNFFHLSNFQCECSLKINSRRVRTRLIAPNKAMLVNLLLHFLAIGVFMSLFDKLLDKCIYCYITLPLKELSGEMKTEYFAAASTLIIW